MKDTSSTEQALQQELAFLKQRVAELEQKEAQHEGLLRGLRVSESKYRLLLDSMKDVAFIVDLGLNTTYVSPSIEKVLGYTPEERMNQGPQDQLTPESFRKAVELLACELARDRDEGVDPDRSQMLELEYYHKDGSLRWLETNFRGIRDDQGILISIYGLARDITERKRAEEALQKASSDLQSAKDMVVQSEKLATVGRLASGAAHEIRNPLNVISLRLQLMSIKEGLEEGFRRDIDICMAEIGRIDKIVESLRKCSRMSGKKLSRQNIRTVIDNVLSLNAPRIKVDEVTTRIWCNPDLPMIFMNKDTIEQVFMNLLTNALDAMRSKDRRELSISVLKKKDNLQISFADSGHGISEDALARLFDPFFTTKDPDHGTGLGLFISKEIVEDHGGRIWAENNQMGGASFFVELPVEKRARPSRS